MRAAREAWCAGQLDLDPDRLVFLDETAASTNRARRYGRAPRGERCRMAVPQSHWKTTTITAGLRASGVTAPWLLDGAMNGQAFRTYVQSVLAPALRIGLPGGLARRVSPWLTVAPALLSAGLFGPTGLGPDLLRGGGGRRDLRGIVATARGHRARTEGADRDQQNKRARHAVAHRSPITAYS